MKSPEIAISLKDVSKVFERYQQPIDRLKQALMRERNYAEQFWALKNINLEIPRFCSTGIVGLNGAGKSTLLQIIAGTLQPTSGIVEKRGRVGALLELGSGFNPDFSGLENVFFSGQTLGLSIQEINDKLEEILDFAGIGDFINRPIRTYSSGMSVRLAFAVATVLDPDILIVDEALSVGDASFQFKCLRRIRELQERGLTLLFVSHDISAVSSFCDDAIYLSEGKVKLHGPASEVIEWYCLDVRDQQREQMVTGIYSIAKKTSLKGEHGFAFGTQEGRIKSAYFLSTKDLYSAFTFGETATFRVDIELLEEVESPCLSMMIHDEKSFPIGGSHHELSKFTMKRSKNQEVATYTAYISFAVRFSAKNYFITLRLEKRDSSESTVMPIEKQFAVLTFTVVNTPNTFSGIVDLGIQFSALPKSSESQTNELIQSQAS